MWDEDEEDEWERVMGMTDEEVEAELILLNDEMARATVEWEARTPRPQQYAHHRRGWLELCLKNRANARKYPDMPTCLFVDGLKRCQMGLWKLRWWYRTGTWPPSAD